MYRLWTSDTAQKMKVLINDFFSKCDQIADLVTFTEEILNGKLNFLYSVMSSERSYVLAQTCFQDQVYLSIFDFGR